MIVFRLLMVVFLTHLSLDVLSQGTDSLKCWSSTERLMWSDFRGKGPSDESNSYLEAVSSIMLDPILVKKNNGYNYRVRLVFRRYKSWKIDTADYLLDHEQLHFDIAELLARKLRKAIQASHDPTGKHFRPVLQKLYEENAIMQTAYDKDTAHGIIRESQAIWKKEIFIELKKLKEFGSTPADCE